MTVQNALEKICNRFDLVLLAAKRARQIQIYNQNIFLGTAKTDKCTVIALREIEAGLINKSIFNIIIIKDRNIHVSQSLSAHQSGKNNIQ
ncbi:MAG: DNA-directed RNA polymerase subunit omega [Candidatus Dasytiphilus stammeri]